MTVKELKTLLDGVNEDLQVFFTGPAHIDGRLAFVPACVDESGVAQLPVDDHSDPEDDDCEMFDIFLLAKHGYTEEVESESDPTLN